MSLDKTRWGNSIAAAVKSIGISAGSPITDAQLEQVWQKFAEASKAEINTNAGIQMAGGDLNVNISTGASLPMSEAIGRIK